jgi:hypothetical protein
MLWPREAPAHHGHIFEPVCINVTDSGSSLFTLRVAHRYMLEPDSDDIRSVKAIINSAEPGLGVSIRTGRSMVLVTLNGTVAGFFTAMQLHWDPRAGSGTGRVLGELTAHPNVQLTQYRCP